MSDAVLAGDGIHKRYEHRKIFTFSDATQNLLQNQHLDAILINEMFFFVSCKPGLNFAIEK